MNFEDEPYIRIYQRDTKTWLKLGFEGQSVLVLLMRKLDRAGVLDDVTEPAEDVALVLRATDVAFVRTGLERCLREGVFELQGSRLVAPRYVEGQTAIKSDRLRAAELRKRRRDLARAGHPREPHDSEVPPVSAPVTREPLDAHGVTDEPHGVTPDSRPVSEPSRGITPRSETSRGVTPSLADPSLAYEDPPNPPEGAPMQSVSTTGGKPGKRSKPLRAKSLCPPDLKPDTTTAETAWELGFTDAVVTFELGRCIDWARSKSVMRADWQATFRNWLRTSAEQRGLTPRAPRDEKWEAYQREKLAAETAPLKRAPKPEGYERMRGGLFGG